MAGDKKRMETFSTKLKKVKKNFILLKGEWKKEKAGLLKQHKDWIKQARFLID